MYLSICSIAFFLVSALPLCPASSGASICTKTRSYLSNAFIAACPLPSKLVSINPVAPCTSIKSKPISFDNPRTRSTAVIAAPFKPNRFSKFSSLAFFPCPHSHIELTSFSPKSCRTLFIS